MEVRWPQRSPGTIAYQPLIINQDGRQIAYVGHHNNQKPLLNPLNGKMEVSGTSIVDVTDPANTKYLAHIATGEGRGNGGAQMVRVCSGNTLPRGVKGKWYLLRPLGDSAHEIWDVTVPAKPTKLTTVVDNLTGTHKSWWECDTGIAYLVANNSKEGWTGGNHLKIYDLSDPAKPCTSATSAWSARSRTPGDPVKVKASTARSRPGPRRIVSTSPTALAMKGVISIVDRKKLLTDFKNPLTPTKEELLAPQVGHLEMSPDQGAHTTFPIYGVPIPGFQGHQALASAIFSWSCRKPRAPTIADRTSRRRSSRKGRPAPHLAFLLDISNEPTPWPLSTFRVQETQGDYCGRGGTLRRALIR
jgi:hypothetical protein